MGVAPYGDYTTQQKVADMYNLGWPGVASHDGLGTRSAPYTEDLGTAYQVAVAMAYAKLSMWWLSFWTISGPTGGDSWYNAGYKAGTYVANVFKQLVKVPNYVILDAEGYNGAPSSAQQWRDFTNGWAAGLATYDVLKNRVAFYCNQWEYQTYSLSSLSLPAFVAISPILNNEPFVSGSNIKGFCAYYAECPLKPYVDKIESWGKPYNTVQMSNRGLPTCGPRST